jgi:PAS domain S-box-containing protein
MRLKMENNYHEIFRLAANYFFEKYRQRGGTQRRLARKLGVTQPYISSVLAGKRTASIDLQSQVAGLLYGPYDEFLTIGRRIKNGLNPEMYKPHKADDSVESLIARLSHYVIDHKRIEDELVQTRGFFEDIVENLQSAVLVTDANDNITYVNKYMEYLSGMPKDMIIGINMLVVKEGFPANNTEELMLHYLKARESMAPVFYENISAVNMEGRKLHGTGWMIPIKKKNKYNGIILTAQDMTRQHLMNQAFNASLEFFENAVAISLQEEEGGPVISYNMNKAGMELLGLDNYNIGHDNIKKSMLLAAANMKNGDEWLEFTRNNFMGREKAELEVHMQDGTRYIWDSNALRGPNREYYGRIVQIRKV